MNPQFEWFDDDGRMITEHLSQALDFVPLPEDKDGVVDYEKYSPDENVDPFLREKRKKKGNNSKTMQPEPVLFQPSPSIRRNGICPDGSKKPGNHPCPEEPAVVSKTYK